MCAACECNLSSLMGGILRIEAIRQCKSRCPGLAGGLHPWRQRGLRRQRGACIALTYCGWHAHCQRHVHSNAAPFPDAGSVVAEDPGSHLQQQHYALSNLRCFMILWHLRDWPFRTVTGCQEAVTHRAWAGDLVGYLCVLSAHCSLCMVQQGHCRVAPGLLG